MKKKLRWRRITRFSIADYERIGALRVQKHDENGFDFEKMIKRKMDAGLFQDILGYLLM